MTGMQSYPDWKFNRIAAVSHQQIEGAVTNDQARKT